MRTDFHFKMPAELRQRIGQAVKRFTVRRWDGRRAAPMVSQLVVAFIERGLARVEAGESILDAPSLVALAAQQRIGDGAKLDAPLASGDIYTRLTRAGRPPSFAETEALEIDAAKIQAGSAVVIRGDLFTDPEGSRDQALTLATGKVRRISRKRATVRIGRKDHEVHVFDLVPVEAGGAP